MMRTLGVLFIVFAGLAAAPSAFAKGETVKIEIKGGSLTKPLEITAPDIVGKFNIWNGPGVAMNNQPVHLDPDRQAGMFIDWPKGKAAQRPEALQRFEVKFQLRFGTPPNEKKRSYTVLYEFDPATVGGYIYLPDSADKKYGSNTSLIVHGVEGNWFYASSEWERVVRPLIEEAQHASPSREGDAVAVAAQMPEIPTSVRSSL